MQSGHELSIRKKYFGQQVDKNSMQTQKCLKIDELRRCWIIQIQSKEEKAKETTCAKLFLYLQYIVLHN